MKRTTEASLSHAPGVAGLYRSCPPSDSTYWRRCSTCAAPLRWDLTSCTGYPRHVVEDPKPWLYASRTGTRRNLAEQAANRYRILATPENVTHYSEPMPPWAFCLDNGAWSAHAAGAAFDGDAYLRAVDLLGHMADWIAVPDIVLGGLASLDLSLSWLPRLRGAGRLLLPVQDGMTAKHVEHLLCHDLGIFVGGSTEWKEQTMGAWARLARKHGAWCHVGRVNTQRRLAMVVEAGADSCDGTTATRFSIRAAPLARAAAQGPLFGTH